MSGKPGEPRGVLRRQGAHGRFQHERRLPSSGLAGLVEHYWYVSWDLRLMPPQLQATLPHPNVHLVIERNASTIYGVQTERFERRLEGQDFVFGIKFRPGGFHPFLQEPVSTLANRSLPAQDVFGIACESLAPRIAASASVDAMTAVAEAFLLGNLPAPDPAPDPDIARAGALVSAIADDLGITSVNRLMTTAAIDKRSLQRLFQKYVGIGPKWVIKRYRLHEAIARIQDGAPVDWAALAAELGYFDQSHFGRDFRALMGQSPTGYAQSLIASAAEDEQSISRTGWAAPGPAAAS